MDTSDGKMKSKSRVAMDPLMIASASAGKSMSGFGRKSLSRMRVRKQSYGFSGISGIGGQARRRSSQLGLEFKRPALVYLPTFQLEPRVKFRVAQVTKAINTILDAFYDDSKYSITDTPGKTMLIADEVMRTVRNMNFDRYRIISVVTIAQKRAQCYNNAVAFLWDHEFDSLVDVHRENNNTSFIQVTVFGIYLD